MCQKGKLFLYSALGWLGLLFWFPLVVLATDPVYMSSLRIQPDPYKTRFIFTLSQKTYGRVRYLPNPHRLLIEFHNTRQRFAIRDAKLAGSNIESLATFNTTNTLQFIMRVKTPVKWNIQFLPQKTDKGVQLQWEVISVQPVLRPIKQKESVVKKKISTKLITQTVKQVDQLLAQRTPLKISPVSKPRRFVVVIDAGHGGKDTGAIGASGTQEKDVVLNIAQKLAKEINAAPNMRAVMTRNGDYFVPLYDRLKLARKGDADLFIAIHADAAFDQKAAGASVYTLSQRGASTMIARWLAARENHDELGDVQLDALQDQSTTLRSVLLDMAQVVTRQDSLRLGTKILDAIDKVARLHYAQVEPAPFLVLKSPDIPSVLVETGFISNRWEEERLADSHYQQKIAYALWQGIYQYIVQYAG